MLRTTKKLALGAAAALIGSTVISGAAFVNAADASSVTHTLKFATTADRSHDAGRFSFEQTEIERNHGRWVGYDVLTGTFNPRTESLRIFIAITRKGGILFGRVHDTSDTTYVGRITGGSGRFAGATGTITAHNAPHNNNRTFVTVHYTLP